MVILSEVVLDVIFWSRYVTCDTYLDFSMPHNLWTLWQNILIQAVLAWAVGFAKTVQSKICEIMKKNYIYPSRPLFWLNLNLRVHRRQNFVDTMQRFHPKKCVCLLVLSAHTLYMHPLTETHVYIYSQYYYVKGILNRKV